MSAACWSRFTPVALLRYQQAYQAMAQVISMSNQMFTSLIQAVG